MKENWETVLNFKDVLFIIFFLLSLILLVWTVFGNSPTEFIALITLNFTIILKLWSVSDRLIKLEARFNHLAQDFQEHKTRK
jgi:hypothetical protein